MEDSMFISPLMSLSMNTSMMTILLLTTMFIKNPMTEKKTKTHNHKFKMKKNKKKIVITLRKLAAMSVMPLIMHMTSKSPPMFMKLTPWIQSNLLTMNMELKLDLQFNLFLTTALLVSWSMLEFSLYYMKKSPLPKKFFRLLMMFLLKMIILTSTKKMFLMFMGWEGVGFLSFLLMSWWATRKSAKKSAMQAMMYNRIGDMGMLAFFAITLTNFNSWSIPKITKTETSKTKMLLLGLLLAATGKSAQFGLHPWLPAAMEGPTPVSALLHSSTMVMAGIFLLIRLSHMFKKHPKFKKWSLTLGAMTAMFAATTAITQHDIKKMMAYSTTSQLGLMMMAMGLNQPNIALFHMCTHAFFKAMLFLSSGSMMHKLSDEQDMRKMGGLHLILPKTSACMMLGSLALSGTPFLAGFYSKDLILETGLSKMSKLMKISLALIATTLTSVYSIRMMLFCFLLKKKQKTLLPTSEKNQKMTKPLNRLAMGTIMSGWVISVFVITKNPMTMKNTTKKLAMMATMTGMILSMSLLPTLKKTPPKKTKMTKKFLSKQWFYQKMIHTLYLKKTYLTSLLLSTRKLDQGWMEKLTAQGSAYTIQKMSQKYQKTQTGYMKQYLLASTTTMLAFLLLMKMVGKL